ncbi:hypothetical protein K439DRAFT_1619356 [Ramaria rubella]|nr:hypothetical protein K439DRAFT_1619356 [Ramaria rubella]
MGAGAGARGGEVGQRWWHACTRVLRQRLGCAEGARKGVVGVRSRSRGGQEASESVWKGLGRQQGWTDGAEGGQTAQRGPRGRWQFPKGTEGGTRAAGVRRGGHEDAEGGRGMQTERRGAAVASSARRYGRQLGGLGRMGWRCVGVQPGTATWGMWWRHVYVEHVCTLLGHADSRRWGIHGACSLLPALQPHAWSLVAGGSLHASSPCGAVVATPPVGLVVYARAYALAYISKGSGFFLTTQEFNVSMTDYICNLQDMSPSMLQAHNIYLVSGLELGWVVN